jgi:hypothetical protein
VKKILSDPTKVINNRTSFGKNFFEIYARRLIRIIFKIKENMLAGVKWVDVSVAELKKRNCNNFAMHF